MYVVGNASARVIERGRARMAIEPPMSLCHSDEHAPVIQPATVYSATSLESTMPATSI